MPSKLYIDVRMRNHSGIGTYIRNVVGRLVYQLPSGRFSLLGGAGEVGGRLPEDARRQYDAPIYSIREQLIPLRFGLARNDLYWSPHYNMPALLRCRHLVTIHDVLHLAMPEFAGGVVKQTYAKVFFSQVASRAARVICVSRSTADELIRLTGIPSEKVGVIYNGVDPFWGLPSTVKRPLPAPYFLFVGNVKPHKNLRRLIAAMRLFSDEHPDFQLVIVGKRDGFISGDPDAVREAESMPGKVTFTGYVDDETLKAYFQHAEALVFPSLYEGFGLPLVEAMACGCPVIASDIPVHREVCEDAAVFCDANSIAAIAEKMGVVADFDASTRQDLIARGKIRAKRFDWGRCASETRAVLQELLAS